MYKLEFDPERPLVWSASSTPFNDDMSIDIFSVEKMVDHHLRLGVSGLFLAGTSGEGMCLTRDNLGELLSSVVRSNAGRMKISAQVTDRSVPRILENIIFACDHGVEIAVIAPPDFMPCPSAENIERLYLGAIERSPLPVAIYDLGRLRGTFVPDRVIRKIYRHEKVVAVKDSSLSMERRRIALAARRRRPDLVLFNGCEFDCVDYLRAGYDGLLLGGGIFNGSVAGRIFKAVRSGDITEAERLQKRLNRIMYAVFGGRTKKCWLSGQKKLLVEMGVFRTWKSYYNFPLTESCRKAIDKVMAEEIDFLSAPS